MSINKKLFNKINKFADRWDFLDEVAVFFAHYSGFALVISLFGFLFLDYNGYKEMVWRAVLAGILSRFIFAILIYKLFPKKRPFLERTVNLILNPRETASFPSGHATFFFAISTVVFAFNPAAGKIFFLISGLMGISRIFGGVHWPVDVLFGALLGVFSGWVVLF